MVSIVINTHYKTREIQKFESCTCAAVKILKIQGVENAQEILETFYLLNYNEKSSLSYKKIKISKNLPQAMMPLPF